MPMLKRSNAKLDCDVSHVAALFASTNLIEEDELNQARLIIQALKARQYSRAKLLCDDFARPEFGSAMSYYRRKQFTALLTKVPFAGDAMARKKTAIKAFYQAEKRCSRVNKKFRHFAKYPNRMPPDVRVILTRAREWVRRVLGEEITPGKLGRLIALARPGGGVAIGTHNRFRVSLPFKLGDTDLSVTSEAYSYARMLVEGSPAWIRLRAEIDWSSRTYKVPYTTASGNRITFVPKDARTQRTIAIEPSLNVCLQLGVHSYIAGRLKDFGNSIDDQSRNQQLACFGSAHLFGTSVSTIDLSQASDSVSTEFVRWLLPSDWFSYLDDIRCKTGILSGESLCYEKFSSMGNGYTFALETLLFWALGKAVNSLTGGDVLSVYGDDIIISDCSSALLLEALQWSGFVINSDKTFITGPFRESCGADWHVGTRVTPQYIRKAELRCTDVYLLLNRADPVLNWAPVREYLLAKHREVEPVLFGLDNEVLDSCLFSTFDYVKGGGNLKWHRDWQTWTFSGWSFKPAAERVPRLTAYTAALFGSLGSDSRYQLRGRGVFRLVPLTPGYPRDRKSVV